MRVLIVSCVFTPEPVVSARTSAEIAGAMTRNGNDVTVIAPFPNRPGGKLYSGYHRKLFHRELSSQGFTIIRCFATLSTRSNMLGRLAENISFGITGGLTALFSKRIDVIYANTWPIIATGILSLVAHLRRIPMVISVQDVYPESLIAQQRLACEGRLARWLRKIDKRISQGSKAVVVISEQFEKLYRKRGVTHDHIRVVPNWVNPEAVIVNNFIGRKFRERLGIPSQAFVAVYAGNIGRASGVETCLEAFQFLTLNEDIYLLIAGEGSQLNACRELAAKIGINRIKIYSPWPESETSTVLSAADCLLLPTLGQQSLASVPSKMISYMYAARPIIAMSLPQSETSQTIQQADCGRVLPPAAAEQLAATLSEFQAMTEAERNRMGRSGREYALAHFSANVCLPRILAVLERSERK